MQLYKLKIVHIVFGIGILAFLIGFFLLPITNFKLSSSILKIQNVELAVGKNLFTILKINLLIGLGIIIGFVTYNFFSIFLFIFNMITTGLYFNFFFRNLGISKSLYLLLPHGIIEISWLFLITIHSLNIFSLFKQSVNSNFQNINFVYLLISRKTLVIFILIIFSALIEAYITPYINNFLL